VAVIGTGGLFLRLQVPERHADALQEGAEILIGGGEDARTGRLAKLYPRIAGGRVQADIEGAALDARFVGRRIVVRLPVGQRQALAVPTAALTHRGGLDFVTVVEGDTRIERVVLPGEVLAGSDGSLVEILAGLAEGETVAVP